MDDQDILISFSQEKICSVLKIRACVPMASFCLPENGKSLHSIIHQIDKTNISLYLLPGKPSSNTNPWRSRSSQFFCIPPETELLYSASMFFLNFQIHYSCIFPVCVKFSTKLGVYSSIYFIFHMWSQCSMCESLCIKP